MKYLDDSVQYRIKRRSLPRFNLTTGPSPPLALLRNSALRTTLITADGTSFASVIDPFNIDLLDEKKRRRRNVWRRKDAAMIRAAHNLLSELQPTWVNARVRLPYNASGLVLLVHNEPPARKTHLCEQIASSPLDRRLGICTVGLTHANEHVRGRLILDVESLTDRLHGVITFLRQWNETSGLPIALFGEDICAASVVAVASDPPPELRVAGSFCGRPDLARLHLPMVCLPTLLVVAGGDRQNLERNEEAFSALNCPSQIAVIGNATRSLRGEGAVGACRYLIRRWCEQHLLAQCEVAP
jgi:hypothetical protein